MSRNAIQQKTSPPFINAACLSVEDVLPPLTYLTKYHFQFIFLREVTSSKLHMDHYFLVLFCSRKNGLFMSSWLQPVLRNLYQNFHFPIKCKSTTHFTYQILAPCVNTYPMKPLLQFRLHSRGCKFLTTSSNEIVPSNTL